MVAVAARHLGVHLAERLAHDGALLARALGDQQEQLLDARPVLRNQRRAQRAHRHREHADDHLGGERRLERRLRLPLRRHLRADLLQRDSRALLRTRRELLAPGDLLTAEEFLVRAEAVDVRLERHETRGERRAQAFRAAEDLRVVRGDGAERAHREVVDARLQMGNVGCEIWGHVTASSSSRRRAPCRRRRAQRGPRGR